MRNTNYINSAGSSIMSDTTVDAMTQYLKLGKKVGGYESMLLKQEDFNLFYHRVAQLINNRNASEIAFTDGGSRV